MHASDNDLDSPWVKKVHGLAKKAIEMAVTSVRGDREYCSKCHDYHNPANFITCACGDRMCGTCACTSDRHLRHRLDFLEDLCFVLEQNVQDYSKVRLSKEQKRALLEIFKKKRQV